MAHIMVTQIKFLRSGLGILYTGIYRDYRGYVWLMEKGFSANNGDSNGAENGKGYGNYD